jgi:O-acetyl-ADP-ribose deacetylase (regulator of RNase III)
MQINFGDSGITLIHGSIVDLAVDAIVRFIDIDSIASVISGGELPSKFIIQVPNPLSGSSGDDRKLADTIQNALHIAETNGYKSLAFPDIDSQISLDSLRCAKVMLITTIAHLRGGSSLNRIIFCLQQSEIYSVFQEELSRLVS